MMRPVKVAMRRDLLGIQALHVADFQYRHDTQEAAENLVAELKAFAGDLMNVETLHHPSIETGDLRGWHIRAVASKTDRETGVVYNIPMIGNDWAVVFEYHDGKELIFVDDQTFTEQFEVIPAALH